MIKYNNKNSYDNYYYSNGKIIRELLITKTHGMYIYKIHPKSLTDAVSYNNKIEELWFIINGIGKIWIKNNDEENVFDIKKNDTLFITNNENYQLRNDDVLPLEILVSRYPSKGDIDDYTIVSPKWFLCDQYDIERRLL